MNLLNHARIANHLEGLVHTAGWGRLRFCKMHVGVIKIYLSLSGSTSLKGKRQLIRPVIAQVQNRFNVSIAEVEQQDRWEKAVLGICFVSGDAGKVDEMISRVTDFIESGRFSVKVVDSLVEVIPV